MTWKFFLLILFQASCKPETLIFCQEEFNDNWWQISLDNEFYESQLTDEYGEPICFYFKSETQKLFIHNEEEYVSILDYSMIDDNIYDIPEIDVILTVYGKENDSNIWDLNVNWDTLGANGIATLCPIDDLDDPL